MRPADVSDKNDVKAADQTRVELSDGRLLVKVPRPRGWHTRGGGSVDVTIELPAGSRLDATVGWGELRCDGPLGDCRVRSGLGPVLVDEAATLRVKSGAGDVSAERVAGKAEVTTGTGEVRLGEVGGAAVVKNSNGNTSVGAVGGDLRVHTANGNIAVESAAASVVAKSANGDVRVGEVARGAVALETHAGEIEVGIREGSAAWLDATAAGGRVRSELDAADGPEAAGDTVEIRARTSLGDIVVRRAAAQPAS